MPSTHGSRLDEDIFVSPYFAEGLLGAAIGRGFLGLTLRAQDHCCKHLLGAICKCNKLRGCRLCCRQPRGEYSIG